MSLCYLGQAKLLVSYLHKISALRPTLPSAAAMTPTCVCYGASCCPAQENDSHLASAASNLDQSAPCRLHWNSRTNYT